jgi:hypothetical protein
VHDNLQFIEGSDRVVENEVVLLRNFTEMEEASEELFKLMDTLIEDSYKKYK